MFVTNWISTTKIQKISEITNFFRHYFLSRTEVKVYKKYENIGILGVKNNVNVYRFLRKYSVFYISTVCFLCFRFCCFRS